VLTPLPCGDHQNRAGGGAAKKTAGHTVSGGTPARPQGRPSSRRGFGGGGPGTERPPQRTGERGFPPGPIPDFFRGGAGTGGGGDRPANFGATPGGAQPGWLRSEPGTGLQIDDGYPKPEGGMIQASLIRGPHTTRAAPYAGWGRGGRFGSARLFQARARIFVREGGRCHPGRGHEERRDECFFNITSPLLLLLQPTPFSCTPQPLIFPGWRASNSNPCFSEPPSGGDARWGSVHEAAFRCSRPNSVFVGPTHVRGGLVFNLQSSGWW